MVKIKIVVIANIIIYVLIIQAFIRSALAVLVNQEGTGMLYFISQIVVAVFCIICIIGLLLKKNWGRTYTLSWNICLAIILGILPTASIYVFSSNCEGNIFDLFANANIILALFASITLVFFSYMLCRENAKNYFIKNKTA